MQDDVLRGRIIKRILCYSGIYNIDDLNELSLNELKQMQGRTLIPLLVLRRYRKSHL